jgi:hypothetical protein
VDLITINLLCSSSTMRLQCPLQWTMVCSVSVKIKTRDGRDTHDASTNLTPDRHCLQRTFTIACATLSTVKHFTYCSAFSPGATNAPGRHRDVRNGITWPWDSLHVYNIDMKATSWQLLPCMLYDVPSIPCFPAKPLTSVPSRPSLPTVSFLDAKKNNHSTCSELRSSQLHLQ